MIETHMKKILPIRENRMTLFKDSNK